MECEVAIKRLVGVKSDEVLAEARKMLIVRHRNIVEVFDVFEESGTAFIVMELVDGLSLAEKLRSMQGKSWISQDEAVSIFKDCLAAIVHSHQKGVLHRDIKPENILISNLGDAKLADFGIAKLSDGNGFGSTNQFTVDGARTGTEAYMSPEQTTGKPLDYCSDIFSLGIVGYLLLTGRHPFIDPAGLFAPSKQIADEAFAPQSVCTVNQLIPQDLGRVIDRMLLKDQKARYQNAQETIADFLHALNLGKVCMNCSAPNPHRNRFCGDCGRELIQSVTAPVATTTLTSDPAQITNEGLQLAKKDKWVEAIEKYKLAVATDPKHQPAYINWGFALNHIGLHNDAVEVLTKTIDLSPHPAPYAFRAFAYAKLKNYEPALDDFNRSLKLQPDAVRVMLQRAHLLLELDQHSAARSDILQVLKRDPTNQKALRLKQQLKDDLGSL